MDGLRGLCVAGRRPSCKSPRERMCPGAMSRGVRGARWAQIGAIARADMAWRHLEWRLPCQVICRKGGQRPCTAVRGSSETFQQIIARAEMPLEAPRMAIAVPDELQERERPGADGCAWQVGELPAKHRAGRYALERCLEGFAVLDGHKSVPSRERRCPGDT